MSSPLKPKDLELINEQLRDLQKISDDIQRAKAAKIPGIEEVEVRHQDCLHRCIKFKEVYFPHDR